MNKLRAILFTAFTILVVAIAIWGWVVTAHGALDSKAGPWRGTDVNVVEKIASEQGREASKPFIDTDQGDLLLFIFAAAGATAGFIAGYCWRKLITEKKARDNS
jgi:cobalt/nickel transport protein